MAAAATAASRPHGMLSIVGLTDDDVMGICDEVKSKLGANTVCQVANYLFPSVSGLLTTCSFNE